MILGFGIVLVGRCPSADDVPHRKWFSLLAEAFVIALQDFPGSPIAVCHRSELHE